MNFLKKIITEQPKILREELENLNDKLSLVVLPLGGLGLLGSLVRTYIYGWNFAIIFHVLLLLAVVTILYLRKKISPVTIFFVFNILAFIHGSVNTITYGLASTSLLIFGTISLFAAIFFGLKAGVISLLITFSTLAVIGIAICNGFIQSAYDMDKYLTSPIAWYTQITVAILYLTMLILAVSVVYKRLSNTILKISEDEKKYRLLTENTTDVIFTLNNNFDVTYITPSVKRILGYTETEALKLNIKDFDVNGIFGITVNSYKDYFKTLEKNENHIPPIECEFVKKDSSRIWVEITVSFIRDSFGKIIGYQGTIRNIMDRKKFEYDLIDSKEKAETANKVKSEFLMGMSHELRTPLTSILGFSDLFFNRNKDKLSVSEKEYFGIIERNGKYLLSLISRLLDTSRMEVKGITIQSKIIDLKKFLRDIEKSMSMVAKKEGLGFNLELPKTFPPIKTDANRLKQVVLNIVNNSIKFTQKGSVNIKLSSDDNDYAKIEISDTGEGIPSSKQTAIFKKFVQVEPGYKKKFGGIGIGLSISKSIMDKLGGKIEVKSEKGQGSTFIITLPLK